MNREDKELSLEEAAVENVRTGITNEFKIGIMSSVFGFVLGLVGMIGGLARCWIGRWEPGLTAFFFSLAALVGSFLYQARERRAERRHSARSASVP